MTNKTDGDILKNAPDGATHYSWETYCKANKDFFYDWNGEYWCAYFVPDGDMRSLADIKALVAKDKRIAELEREKQVLIKQHDMWKQQWHELNDSLAKRDLELQAKDKKIEELEKFISENTPLLSYLAIETVSSPVDGDPLFIFKDWLARRDLEQQANGAEYVIESVLGEPETLTSDALSIRYEFLFRLKQLREQVKGGAN